MATCEEIGARIKELREQKGLTQAELAEKMNTSRESINQWERGARDMKTGTIITLAQFFGVSCDYILTGVEAEHLSVHKDLGLNESAIKLLCLLNIAAESENEYRLFAKNVLSAFNRMIVNESGRAIMCRIVNYLDMDFSQLYYVPMEKNNGKRGDKVPISFLENAVFAVTGIDKSDTADIISVPLETFETSFILDLLEVMKCWKREGGKGYATQNNP